MMVFQNTVKGLCAMGWMVIFHMYSGGNMLAPKFYHMRTMDLNRDKRDFPPSQMSFIIEQIDTELH